jgi:hypothetical protein
VSVVAGARTPVILSPLMPTGQIVALLIAERDKLNRAIEALQELAKRGVRPPKNTGGSYCSCRACKAPAQKRFTAQGARRLDEGALGKAQEAGKELAQATADCSGWLRPRLPEGILSS